jgi:replicative superfamily II helicase
VGPLKALINDHFSRLEELCREAEIPVHKWHGDVSSSPKRRLLEQPSGVLLITPESIESLSVNHADRLADVFQSLTFIVIDESGVGRGPTHSITPWLSKEAFPASIRRRFLRCFAPWERLT